VAKMSSKSRVMPRSCTAEEKVRRGTATDRAAMSLPLRRTCVSVARNAV